MQSEARVAEPTPLRVQAPQVTRDYLDRAIVVWLERLQLAHWTVTFDPSAPLVESDLGNIERHDPYDYATLKVNTGYTAWTRRDLNLVIVHELMHLHSCRVEYAVESITKQVTAGARAVWGDWIGQEIEALVDKMATLLVNAYGEV
jgi:hypothetical protein